MGKKGDWSFIMRGPPVWQGDSEKMMKKDIPKKGFEVGKGNIRF